MVPHAARWCPICRPPICFACPHTVLQTKTAVQVPRAKPLLAVQVQALLDEMCAVGILQREEIDQDVCHCIPSRACVGATDHNAVFYHNTQRPGPHVTLHGVHSSVCGHGHTCLCVCVCVLKFELTENNMLQAVGTLWQREGIIPMGGPFSAQSADLRTLWKVKRAGKKLRDWGALNISDEGYVYWQRGPLWFSLCQFRDNVLFASNQRPGAHTHIIQTVAETLSRVWDLEVLCPCTDGGADCCVGNCLTQTAQALGISMTVGAGVGLSSTHPSALKQDWDLRFGKLLMTPSRAAPQYLSSIFTSSLTSAQPWLHSWSAQILSALSWVQVARACDYKCMAVMRAMHKTVLRVYSASPWAAENTMRAVYAIGHHQPCPQAVEVDRLMHWLFRNAVWENSSYTDQVIPTELQPEGYTPTWCTDIHLLRARSAKV